MVLDYIKLDDLVGGTYELSGRLVHSMDIDTIAPWAPHPSGS